MELGEIIPGAYRRESDGALVLPIIHWETGELLGYQERVPGRTPLPLSPDGSVGGVPMGQAAPSTHSPADGVRSLLVCEGPTDMVAAVEKGRLDGWTVAGCWSASTLPPVEYWKPFMDWSVFVAGDGDKAGRDFNQKIANIFGVAYVVRIPEGEDVKSILYQGGGTVNLRSMVSQAHYRPLERKRRLPWRGPLLREPGGVDLVRLVEAAGGKLRNRLANGELKYTCPLHDDHDPSLTVNPGKGKWHCWASCGGGNATSFVMRWKHMDRERALEELRRWS